MVWRTIPVRAQRPSSAAPLPPGTYDGEPLVWDAGLAGWFGRSTVVVDVVAAQNAAGPGSSLLIFSGHTVTNREDIVSLGFLNGSQTHILYAVIGGATALKFEADEATGIPKLRFFDNGSAAPQQSITGATTQLQVDSLVAALVAFGLVTDDR